MKVVHVTSAHSSLDTRIFLKEAKTLVRAGYDVSYIVPANTTIVNDGVKIVPIPRYQSRLARFTKTVFAAYRTAIRLGADVYHIHDLDLLPMGICMRLFHGKRVVYDVHENAPLDMMIKDYLPRLLRRPIALMVGALEWCASRLFDRIVAATPVISSRFPKSKTIIVQNFPLKGELVSRNEDGNEYKTRDAIIAYVGGIDLIRGINQIIEGIGLVDSKLDARLAIAGEFTPPELAIQVAAKPGWKRVQFLGQQSREQVKELLARARAGVVTFLPVACHIEAQPTKLFEYMSAGIPVIASNFPLWTHILDQYQCGLAVDPEKPEEICRAIEFILKHPEESEQMGRRGAQAIDNVFNWDIESKKLLGGYVAMAGES